MNLSALACALTLVAPCSAQWSTDQLFVPRYRHTAASVGNKILFAGGGAGSGWYSSVDIYDTSTGMWTVEHLSLARGDFAATSVRGLVLIGGGSLPSNGDRVDVYDAGAGTWSTATLSQSRRDLTASSTGTKALFGGGLALVSQNWIGSNRVDVYDTSSSSWSQASLSQARSDLASTSVGELVLFGGGLLDQITPTAVVDIYDGTTDTWSTSTLSQARHTLVATSVAGKALFAGGYTWNYAPSDRVDIYDSTTGTWSTANLSVGRTRLAATSIGNLALFGGGSGGPGVGWSNVVDIYDSLSGTWTTATLSEGRGDFVAASAGNLAMFGGGFDGMHYHDLVDVFSREVGTIYCSPASSNSTGSPGLLRAEGSLHVAFADLTLIAEQLPPGQFGYFITGLTQGFIQPPGSQGPICLSGNIGRYNRASEIIQGPAGSLRLDLSSLPVNPPVATAPGDTWNFQCWYRDSNPTATSNTTNSLAVTFATAGDPAVQFPVSQARIVEDTTQIEVRITLSQATDEDVILAYAIGGTATVDVDWRVEEPNPFVIPAGETGADMTLVIAGDSRMEPDEVAIVSLAAPIGAVLGTATTFTLTIVDDD